MIYSIDKIKEHTGQQFLGKLEKWIEEVKMSKELNILQIGLANWENHYDIPENMSWYYFTQTHQNPS